MGASGFPWVFRPKDFENLRFIYFKDEKESGGRN